MPGEKAENLISKAREIIPTLTECRSIAWVKLKFTKRFVKHNFSSALIKFDKEGDRVYRIYEQLAVKKLAELWIDSQSEKIKTRFKEISGEKDFDAFKQKASMLFIEFAILVQKLEFSLGQSRKSRGGSAFNKNIEKLLTFIGITCEIPTGRQKEILKRIDLVIPNAEEVIKFPDRTFSLTCKRTLRERWKQEVPQSTLNQRFYLITLDPSLSENKANEIHEKELIAYVIESVYNDPKIKNMSWIRNLNDLPKDLSK